MKLVGHIINQRVEEQESVTYSTKQEAVISGRYLFDKFSRPSTGFSLPFSAEEQLVFTQMGKQNFFIRKTLR